MFPKIRVKAIPELGVSLSLWFPGRGSWPDTEACDGKDKGSQELCDAWTRVARLGGGLP